MFKYCAGFHKSHEIIVKRIGEHNHTGDIARVVSWAVVNDIKNYARQTQNGTLDIMIDTVRGLYQVVMVSH